MKRFITASAFAAAALLSPSAFATQVVTTAQTADGRTVTLHKDGTWRYVSDNSSGLAPSVTADRRVDDPRGMISIAFDSSKWTQLPNAQQLSPSASLSFIHTSGEAYAMAIVERIPMPLETLKRAALQNARSVAPDAKVVLDEVHNIDGVQAALMGIEGNLDGIVFRYHSVYWSGEAGAVQVITFTSSNLFEEYKADLDAFLSGVRLPR